MNFQGILLYSLRAASFAAAIGAIYVIGCLMLHRKLSVMRLAGVVYIAALIQITVLRGGVDWLAVLHESRSIPQLIPMKTTIGEAKLGLWPLVYHAAGNMIWFVPLGMLLRRKTALQALVCGAALSLGIEIMQLILMTGMTDIDDVFLNAAGAWLGRILIGQIQAK